MGTRGSQEAEGPGEQGCGQACPSLCLALPSAVSQGPAQPPRGRGLHGGVLGDVHPKLTSRGSAQTARPGGACCWLPWGSRTHRADGAAQDPGVKRLPNGSRKVAEGEGAWTQP